MNNLLFPMRSYDELPAADEIRFGELVAINLSTTTNSFTHGLHRYPAKFIPQIPRWAIRQYSRPGDIILDPFAGSGTSVVEAIAEGRHGLGVDLDPLACLIGQAKTADVAPERLAYLAKAVLERSQPPTGTPVVPMVGVRHFEHWFSADAWAALQSVKKSIEFVDMSDDERSFFIVIFSSVIRTVSNADDQTQKTYVSGTLKKSPPPVLPTFERRLRRGIESIGLLSRARKGTGGQIICGSATDLPIKSGKVDLLVTSPPYLDSVDYMYNMMLEYFWLGVDLGIMSRSDFNIARRSGIGSKQPSNKNIALPNHLEDLIDIDSIPKYRKSAVAPYFAGMEKHFGEAARVLKPGGRYVLVIGNSRTQGGMLPLHDALVVLAAEAGLQIEHAFGYRIRRHYMKFPRKGRGGIILMDWVITLRKCPAGAEGVRRLPHIDVQLHPDAVAN